MPSMYVPVNVWPPFVVVPLPCIMLSFHSPCSSLACKKTTEEHDSSTHPSAHLVDGTVGKDGPASALHGILVKVANVLSAIRPNLNAFPLPASTADKTPIKIYSTYAAGAALQPCTDFAHLVAIYSRASRSGYDYTSSHSSVCLSSIHLVLTLYGIHR